MSKKPIKAPKPISGGRRIIRKLISEHSEGFNLGNLSSVTETLIDTRSSYRVTRHAAKHLLHEVASRFFPSEQEVSSI